MPPHAIVDGGVSPSGRVVVFLLEGQRYGLRLAAVEHVVPAVALTTLPRAPRIVLGIFSLRGEIVPVVDIRERFGLPRRAISPDQQMIVACTSRRRLAILVDATVGVVEVNENEFVPAETILSGLPQVEGIARTADGLVVIHEVDSFLALEEAAELDVAMSTVRERTRSP